jgi:hypothetical protein
VLLDQEDAASYKEGEEVTLLRWGNVTITAIERGADGKVTAMTGTHDPAATNFSKTKKATWIADVVRTVAAVIFLLPSTRASRLRVITLRVREFSYLCPFRSTTICSPSWCRASWWSSTTSSPRPS